MVIRQSKEHDLHDVLKVVASAFAFADFSDHTEHNLVERLLASTTAIPELSLVAEVGTQIVGYILLTPVTITNVAALHPSLALAPLAVLPPFQGKGIGSALIHTAHRTARRHGYTSIVVLGHPDYYQRFGYQRADHFSITLPIDAPTSHCLVVELEQGALAGIQGRVRYPPEFQIENT